MKRLPERRKKRENLFSFRTSPLTISDILSNLKVIQTVMGHKDIQTTMDIYADCTEEKKQEVIKKMEDKIFVI